MLKLIGIVSHYTIEALSMALWCIPFVFWLLWMITCFVWDARKRRRRVAQLRRAAH